jgi:uncharacterized spore protein YtfJ
MGIHEVIRDMAERLGAAANVKRVYGEPFTVGERTLIPVAHVAYGFGAGSGERRGDESGGEGGGGGGARMSPAGVVEVTSAGVHFVPADLLRPLAAAALAGFALGALCMRLRR